jgi:hypothetical protein
VNWRPISEAPRDGTRLLLCHAGPGTRVFIGWWERAVKDDAGNQRGFWWDAAKYRSECHTKANPPHWWMPLPEPPANG